MKIRSIEIKDVGGIRSLNLENLNSQMNIICGENGVGKTNILDSLAYIFSRDNFAVLSKRKGAEKGEINIRTKYENNFIQAFIDQYDPSSTYNHYSHNVDISQLLYLKVNRVFNYRKETQVVNDKHPSETYNKNISGVGNEDLKNWLILRLGFAKEFLTKTQISNIELAKECFRKLNTDYQFSKVTLSFEVFVKAPSADAEDLYFEFMSSGFKSTLFILLGIIKELDLRFNNIKSAADFDGMILIDEIELHLHPEWQSRIVNILKESFPLAQFFLTTHSPHVIQSASTGEVIALEREDNNVIIREIPSPEYGYQGWTIEEILEHVMGMPDLRTKKYNEIKNRFDKALNEMNRGEAELAFAELDKMLHEKYPLRPLFQMQLDSLGE